MNNIKKDIKIYKDITDLKIQKIKDKKHIGSGAYARVYPINKKTVAKTNKL